MALNELSADQTNMISFEPLTVMQLSIVADEIVERLSRYRPEFSLLLRMQRVAGTRVSELFQPKRWQLLTSTQLQVQPQKGNALRILNLSDLGNMSADDFTRTLADMGRLPQRQYERAFAFVVAQAGLWRKYNDGYMHPSSHMLRHLKIKEMAAQGYDKEYIATWIGEKNVASLDYYLGSLFFM